MENNFLHLKHKYSYSWILIREIVITDFKLRYQGSMLGYVWSLLKPLFMFAILYVLFGLVLKTGETVEHFPVYLLLGLLLWNFFAEVTSISLTTIVGKGDLIRKLNFPKYVLVLSSTIGAFINLTISFVVLIGFMIFNQVDLSWNILYFPLLVLQLVILSVGVGFMLSALYVKFRDISYIWEIVMQAAFYLTPIFYTMDFVANKSLQVAQWQLMNPMAQIIQDSRYALVTSQTQTINDLFSSGIYRLIPVSITIFIVVLAGWYFKKKSPGFAEEV